MEIKRNILTCSKWHYSVTGETHTPLSIYSSVLSFHQTCQQQLVKEVLALFPLLSHLIFWL